ncbi:MAG: type II secretion system protein GspG [Planctomycetota bacterium]|nr:MAG: type II secretion system protein GspG [Planctomycetota bacterium]
MASKIEFGANQMKANRKRVNRRRRAFTLLEVLMVIVILGILAALIVPQFMGTGEKARIDATAIKIKSLDSQLEMFRMHCGRLPTTEEGLEALLTQPDDEALEGKWAGPYIKGGIPRDAWNRELRYEYPGTYNENGYDLSSAGPNGEFGDEDDITNWEKT